MARAKGQLLPDEWLLNSEGVPSRDPNDLYNGGAILPMGGLHGGHKGYGLSFMVTLLGGVMGELGCSGPSQSSFKNGSSLIVIDIGKLGPLELIRAQVDDWIQYVKDTPNMQGHSGVLYPGEIEARTRQERLAKGVSVEEATWSQVEELVKEYDLEAELLPLP